MSESSRVELDETKQKSNSFISRKKNSYSTVGIEKKKLDRQNLLAIFLAKDQRGLSVEGEERSAYLLQMKKCFTSQSKELQLI